VSDLHIWRVRDGLAGWGGRIRTSAFRIGISQDSQPRGRDSNLSIWESEHRPGENELVRRVLGHKSIQTTINFYCSLETTHASEIFTDIVRQRLDFEGKVA
jgi:hypothetical protein